MSTPTANDQLPGNRSSTRFKRRVLLPKPSLQLRMVAGFFGIGALALLTQAMFLAHTMVRFARELPISGDTLAEATPDLVVGALAFSFVALLPLTVLIGAQLTFRTAGPIYHFERHLREFVSGTHTRDCKLRAGDELVELCELINHSLTVAHQRGLEEGLKKAELAEPIERAA